MVLSIMPIRLPALPSVSGGFLSDEASCYMHPFIFLVCFLITPLSALCSRSLYPLLLLDPSLSPPASFSRTRWRWIADCLVWRIFRPRPSRPSHLYSQHRHMDMDNDTLPWSRARQCSLRYSRRHVYCLGRVPCLTQHC